MSIEDPVGVRPLHSPEDFEEARIEAIGFVFHGTVPEPPPNGAGHAAGGGKGGATGTAKRPPAIKAGSNLLHFARCGKLDKVGESEAKIWFRTISIAKAHLDEAVGNDRWKWCKVCEREITQKILNER
jgi:hypothetical protein